MSDKKDQVLGHAADNDGIDEYDNALPGWWLGLFGLTIVWAVAYAADYHLLRPTSQIARYDAEMAAAQVRWPATELRPLSFDDATLRAGGEVFATTCAACHAADLTGGIGPSLVDGTWIHGSEPEQIRATITNGVLDKGMPSWLPVLGPDKIAKVAAFVVSQAKSAPVAPSPSSVTASAPVADASGDPGAQIFEQNCRVCHGDGSGGTVGPSLVDATWIHGGTLADIERTITTGVPDKGMVTWGPILGPEKVKQVAAYVYGLSHGADAAPQP